MKHTVLTKDMLDDFVDTDAAVTLGDKLSALTTARKELLTERKRVNRRIGELKKQGLDPTREKHRTQELGLGMKALDADIEKTLETLQGLLSDTQHPAAEQTRCLRDNTHIAVAAPAPIRSAGSCESRAHVSTSSQAEVVSTAATPALSGYADVTERFRPLECDSATSGPITIEDDIADRNWDDYVDQHPQATIYHSSKAIRLLERTLAHDTIQLAARDANGNLAGVLPLVHLNSRLFGNFLVSLPVFNYGGPLASSQSVGQQLVDEAGRRSLALGCSHAEIRECHLRNTMPSQSHKVAMIRVMPDDPDVLDRSLGARVRNQISKAERLGAALEIGGENLLDAFYAVFTENMRDLGTPVHSRAFFADALATFGQSAFIAVVMSGGKPVAAAFLIGHRDTLEVPWASALRRAKRDNVNMYLYRGILGEAIARGYRYFDFGRSTEGSNTWRFKKQWGARPYPLHWHYWLRDDAALPSLNPDNPRYRAAIRVWQHMPVWLSRQIGPPIVRHLP